MRLNITFIFCCLLIHGYNQGVIETPKSPDFYFRNLGEICVTFELEDNELLQKLTKIISIDNVNGNRVFAYANQREFEAFLDFDIPYNVIPHSTEIPVEITMLEKGDLQETTNWNFYPTYEAYISMMNQFAADYPALCSVFSIGTSVQGRQLMMAKISKNVNVREAEPQFLYTGTMHGDELAGYNFLLRLIDYLLSNYGTDPKATYLLDNVEIWINPLANPDGTYKGGNHTVNSSTRFNANNIDLNRNFPDPQDGPHPDGNAWQPETVAFMQLAENNHFVMSANTHGGVEVMNYPWDTWSRLTADNNWWIYVCREYVDTVHLYSPSTYMTYLNNGITNGYAWYRITGGRQDYMNYFHNCRELTMELSNVKRLATSNLEAYWNYNYRSLLNYIKQVTYGVAGTVTDLSTGEPLEAQITINGHDKDNSFVFTESGHGFYQRLLEAGTYNLTFSAPGYEPVTIDGVVVQRYQKTILNVHLDAGPLNPQVNAGSTIIPTGSSVSFTDNSGGKPTSWFWEFQGGQPGSSNLKNPAPISYFNPGNFDVKLTITNSQGQQLSKIFEDFIRVSPADLMGNKTITTCNSLFYDTGGANGNYSNNQTFTMTFLPGIPGSKLNVRFLEFGLEASTNCVYDWLKIFNGINTSSPLLGTWCGSNSPGTLTANNASGALTFQFKSDNSAISFGWKALISCIVTQEITINEGWTGISANTTPQNTDFYTVIQQIAPHIIYIEGNDGIYYPSNNVNTISAWNSRRGYLVKAGSSALFSIQGTPVLNKTITLKQGWNLLHVPTRTPISTNSLAQLLDPDQLVIREVAGVGIFWPGMGVQSLTHLFPGKAYYIRTNEPVEFIFPDE